jgi:DNA polymerase III gamma/tau subunit
MGKLGQLIKDTQKLYRKVDSLNGKGKHNSMQMKKAMDEIAAYNEKIDESFVSCMLQAYVAQTDYEIQGELLKYKENESTLKLINDFVEQGQKLLNAYQDAIQQLKEDLPLIMEDFA